LFLFPGVWGAIARVIDAGALWTTSATLLFASLHGTSGSWWTDVGLAVSLKTPGSRSRKSEQKGDQRPIFAPFGTPAALGR
jgi:hypothetical protein